MGGDPGIQGVSEEGIRGGDPEDAGVQGGGVWYGFFLEEKEEVARRDKRH